MQVSLVMFKADGTRRDFPVKNDRMVVGRKNNCDLRIPLSSVSRQHCEVRIEDDEVKLRDLGSSNGTYHNGIRVQETTLSAGDELVVGPVVFVVTIDGEPNDIQAVRTMVDGDDDGDDADGDESLSMPTMVPETDASSAKAGQQGEADLDIDLDDDDDPLATLERMAEAERTGTSPSTDSNDSSEFDFDFLDDDDDDDDKK